MVRWRAGLGLFTGIFLLLSACAHSFLGGAGMRDEMAKARVPEDLARSLSIGWHFGGAAMVVFGAVVVWLFLKAWRGLPVALAPVRFIAAGYLLFGAWAFVSGDFAGFFLVAFVMPGTLLLVASAGGSP